MAAGTTIEEPGRYPPVVPGSWRERRLIVMLSTCSFLAFLNFAALAPFLSDVARDLGTTVPLVGQVTTALTLVSAVLGLAVGPLADLRGHRKLIVIGVWAVALNLVGMAFAPGFAVLLPMSVLAAVGDAILFGLPYAVASELIAEDGQRRAFAWISGGLSLGVVAAPTLLALLGNAVGWRSALLLAGLTTLLATLPALRWLPPDAAGGGRFGAQALADAYRPLADSRPMVLLYGAGLLRAAGLIGVFSYYGAFIADRYGAGPEVVGLAYLGAGLGVLAGDVLSATAALRWSPRILATGPGLAACLLLGAAFAAPLPLPAAVALTAVAALASSVSYVGLTTLMAKATPAGTGTTMVLNGSVINLGTAIGAAAGGLLIAAGGYALLGLGVPLVALGMPVLILLAVPQDAEPLLPRSADAA